MPGEYPVVGFHFKVTFEDISTSPEDIKFQEVSGFTVDVETESLVEGGENRFTHQLPTRTRYSDLTLKRGVLPISSGLFDWFKESIDLFLFSPINLTVFLLNEAHEEVASWHIVNAVPKRWEYSTLNAEQSSIFIETMVLSYQYFTHERFFSGKITNT